MADWIEEKKDGHVYIHLLVRPRSSMNEISGLQGNLLKVKITSPPVDGAANSLLVEFLAKKMAVARSRVELVSGEKSRKKTMRIEGISKTEAASRLGLDFSRK